MASTGDYRIPEGKSWTDPCPGSVTTTTNLEAVTAQINENNNAYLEGRPAEALGVVCPFCGNYHLEAQPSVESLIGGVFSPPDMVRTSQVPTSNPPTPTEESSNAEGPTAADSTS